MDICVSQIAYPRWFIIDFQIYCINENIGLFSSDFTHFSSQFIASSSFQVQQDFFSDSNKQTAISKSEDFNNLKYAVTMKSCY